MGDPVNKAAEAEKIYRETEAFVAAAEKLLQQVEALRKKTLAPEMRESFEKESARHQQEWATEMQNSIRDTADHYYELGLQNSKDMLYYMDEMIRSYPEANTEALQQKRAAFAEQLTEFTVVPELPALDKRAMEAYDTNVGHFDQVTAEESRRLQKFIAEVKQELAALKKSQEEILKQQKALDKADFHGDMEKEQKLLEAQQKNLTDKGQQLRDALKKDVDQSAKLVSQAGQKLRDANQNIMNLFLDPTRDEKIKSKVSTKQKQNAVAMRESCREAKAYCKKSVLVFEEPRHRAELETVFDGISDTSLSRRWFRKRDDTAFQNMRTAVADYLQNGGEEKAKKAYGECRNYLLKWMKQDGQLRGGNATENTRNQGVVRMLELMEKMPDFQNFIYQKSAKKEKAPDDWVLVGENDLRYNKLNFKALESSLEKHAVKAGDEALHIGKQESSKSFTDLNQRIEAKKAKARAAREKAAAKAAKDAAKAAKAAKKAKAKSGKAK